MVAITKTSNSININGSTYNVNNLKCSIYGREIRISHVNNVIVDRTLYSDISYNGAILLNPDALVTLSTNLTS